MIREQADSDGFLAGLVDKYAPTSGTFFIVSDRGDYFKFRHVEGHDELVRLRKSAREWLAAIARDEIPEAWRPVMSSDQDTLLYVFHIAALNIECGQVLQKDGKSEFQPAGKLEHLHVLTIAKKAPHLFDAIKLGIDQRMHVAAMTMDSDALQEAEKKSEATGSGANGSQPVATSGESTPAN